MVPDVMLSSLGTLKEETDQTATVTLSERTASNSLTIQNNNSNIPKNECKKHGYHSKGSSSASSNSRTVRTGIGRRPSDNMLGNLMNEEGDETGVAHVSLQSMMFQQPPSKKALSLKTERPISNDSIVTEAADLLSSHLNMSCASASNSSSSRGSFIVIDQVENCDSGAVAVSVEGDSDLTERYESNLTSSTVHDSEHELKTWDSTSRASVKTKYMFTNSCRNKSQVSFLNANTAEVATAVSNTGLSISRFSSPPPKNTIHSIPAYSKTTPSLVTTSKAATPSQRLRLRREQNKVMLQKSIKDKETFYDEQESPSLYFTGSSAKSLSECSYIGDEVSDDMSNYLGWDVPVASPSAAPFLSALNASPRQTKHDGKKRGKLERSQSSTFVDSFQLPPSPIPGIQNVTDLQFFQQTSRTLSSVYTDSSKEFSKSKLWERTKSAEVLPMEFKTASDEGMEDLKLVSSGKLAMCSPSRPTWLPPKDVEERAKHEKQIRQAMNIASVNQMDKNKEHEERQHKNEINRKKLAILIDRGLTRKSSLHDLKKICWETSLASDARYFVYRTLLQSETAKVIEEKYIDDLSKLEAIFQTMKFPHEKLQEIKVMVAQMPCVVGEPPKELVYLLQLKAISKQGLLIGDELLFYHFLITEHLNLSEVWVLVNLLQQTCFNEVTKDRYENRILNPRGVMANYLANDKAFSLEFNSKCLNFVTWWNIMARLDHEFFMWCIDVIVAENSQPFKSDSIDRQKYEDKDWDEYREKHVIVNYKILCSLALNVLLNYHFGFNDFYELSLIEKRFQIIGPELHATDDVHSTFVKKWRNYYKKF
ncbi:uncharacterized protein Ecym_5506 [Eremothecium cymbalariae DBVPG|uniref:Uncharacterized protein n=1 Tax=Eremothecium cymbalariae (strain CBS 270.75 / DBVPG 7215 / KCTC 17166 / NRRL Y-17582) TaxID=931890 RepID=I6NDV7_ERECY|nr:hypothetical protein Ecym_5506 [Eremothecium cymbalariae DBVPG\